MFNAVFPACAFCASSWRVLADSITGVNAPGYRRREMGVTTKHTNDTKAARMVCHEKAQDAQKDICPQIHTEESALRADATRYEDGEMESPRNTRTTRNGDEDWPRRSTRFTEDEDDRAGRGGGPADRRFSHALVLFVGFSSIYGLTARTRNTWTPLVVGRSNQMVLTEPDHAL